MLCCTTVLVLLSMVLVEADVELNKLLQIPSLAQLSVIHVVTHTNRARAHIHVVPLFDPRAAGRRDRRPSRRV